MKRNNLLVTLRRELITQGGVRAYWNALLSKKSSFNDFNLTVFEMGGIGKNKFRFFSDQIRFRRRVKNDVDLVFLNPSLGFKSFIRDGLFALQLSKNKIPFVVFFHGWDLDFEKKVSNNYTKFFLNSFGRAKKIFVLSEDFKNKIETWGYKGEVVVETTNVDATLLDNFDIKNKLNDIEITKKIKILFLARLLKEKGVFETVNVFRELDKKYSNLELIIAGVGEDYEELKEYVKMDKNIIVKGHVQGNDKVDLFTNAHIYSFPTFYGEGLPTSILEAMAFGIPVITTNMGGLKYFFKDQKMGYLVEPRNEDQLKEKMELLILNKNIMTDISKYNSNYANDYLLSDVVAKRINNHLKDLL